MKIKMPRGDIRRLKFVVKDQNGSAVTFDFDEIYFTCKKRFEDAEYIFQKRLTDGTITKLESGTYSIKIAAADTEELNFGDYAFDIEVVLGDEIKQTTEGVLVLTKEATHARNEG